MTRGLCAAMPSWLDQVLCAATPWWMDQLLKDSNVCGGVLMFRLYCDINNSVSRHNNLLGCTYTASTDDDWQESQQKT